MPKLLIQCINCGAQTEIEEEFAQEQFIDGVCPSEMIETTFIVMDRVLENE